MKAIMKVLVAMFLVFAISTANAQVMDSTGKMTPKDKMMHKEYVTMSGGAVMHFVDGKSTALAAVFVADDGTQVATDGTVTKKDGKTMKLNEGDRLYKDGHMTWGSKKSDTGDKPGKMKQ